MFASVAASFGLCVNFTKTKLMGCGVGLSDVDRQRLSIGSHTVGYVDSFVYLGSLLSSDTRVSADIDRRLASASRASGALQCVFRDGNLSVRTKRLVYSACVMSTLLYGAECWATLRRDENRLDAFHHRCLRSILGISRWDQQLNHITNADIRQRWGDIGTVSDILRKRRLQWLGHMARMPEGRLPVQLLFGWLQQHGQHMDLVFVGKTVSDLTSKDCRCLTGLKLLKIDRNGEPYAALSPMRCHDHLEFHATSVVGFSRADRVKPGTNVPQRASFLFRNSPQPSSVRNASDGSRVLGALLCTSAALSLVRRLSLHSTRVPITTLQCCGFHCDSCNRCFRSSSGFKCHNCHRGHRSVDRETFEHVCMT